MRAHGSGPTSMSVMVMLAQVPDPGNGKKPPGFEKFSVILQWAAYIGIALCVFGLIVCAAQMAIEHRSGGSGGIGGGVAKVMIACILIGSASGIVSALV